MKCPFCKREFKSLVKHLKERHLKKKFLLQKQRPELIQRIQEHDSRSLKEVQRREFFGSKEVKSHAKTIEKKKYIELAEEFFIKGEENDDRSYIEKGTQSLEKVLKIDPQDEAIVSSLSEIYAEMNLQGKAERVLRTHLNLVPNNATSWYNLASVYRKGNKYQKAFEALEQSLLYEDREANISDIWRLYGYIYNMKKKFSEAIEAFKKSLKFDSTNSDSWFYLGVAYRTKNDLTKVLEVWEKCLEVVREDFRFHELGKTEKIKTLIFSEIMKFPMEYQNKVKSIIDRYSSEFVFVHGRKIIVDSEEIHEHYNKDGQISGMGGPGTLILYKLGIKNMNEIKGFKKLKTVEQLELSDNKLTDIKDLENLDLVRLKIEDNLINKIKGLENLKNLFQLKLGGNIISEI